METTVTDGVDIQPNKKVYRGWAMYDWANSAYNLVITSTIFPAYYAAVTTVKENDVVVSDKVEFMGRTFTNSVLFDYALAAAYLVIAILSPILSSIADYRGNKKRFMQLFCYLGAAACCGLYFFKGDTLTLGVVLFAVAAIGYCGSLVFYNAFLPEIAPLRDRDKLSAQGFSYGYIGSVILQLICFVFVLKPELFGITDGTFAPRLSFLLVGIWWLLFAQVSFARLPKGKPLAQHPERSILTNGFHELNKVWKQVKQMSVLRTYLGAFFFYSMGVQTVMLAATLFGSKELKLETGQLIATILIIQLVAIAGAYIMAKLSARFGNLQVLLFTVCIWAGICVAAYFIQTAMEFYIIATVVGLVMGGIQSLSRSTYAKLMPATKDTASFFSFYDVTEKVAIVLGMFSFGYIEELTGSMRNSVLALLGFFVIGGIILYIAVATAKRNNIKITVV
jgi:UMF1 family MFS transporter